jgi:hypothetical protein
VVAANAIDLQSTPSVDKRGTRNNPARRCRLDCGLAVHKVKILRHGVQLIVEFARVTRDLVNKRQAPRCILRQKYLPGLDLFDVGVEPHGF